MKEKKMRLDQALVERGLIQSRERAKTTIMAGLVFVNNQKADKAGEQVTAEDIIEVRGGGQEFVSRGGKKLEKALDYFKIDVKGKKAIDAGASTGGFSDCMLKRDVEKIYAVDVGYGQLAWSVRNDPRVVCMERTNVRYINREMIPEELDLAVIDVSFISLSLVLTPICAFSMRARPIVFSNEEEVALQVEKGRAVVTVDGLTVTSLPETATIFVKKAPFTADFLVKENSDFFTKVKTKLNE